MAERVLPHSQEAEESVIGGVLLYSRAFADAAAIAEPQDFYHPALRAIWEAMIALAAASKPIDQVTVLEEMRSTGTADKLRAFGDEDYLTALTGNAITVENIAYHAKIIHDKAASRRLIAACSEIAARGYGEYGDDEDFIAESGAAIATLMAKSRAGTGPVPGRKLLKAWTQEMAQRYERKDVVTGVPTTFTRFDELTCGLQSGDFIVIAGRPSMGKSSFVSDIVRNAGALGHASLVFSLEVSALLATQKLVSAEGRIDGQKLRRAMLDQRDWVAISNATSRLAEIPFWIDDTGAQTITAIQAVASAWYLSLTPALRAARPFVVVDYMQLCEVAKKNARRESSRQQDVSDISRGLKALAKALGIPVIALSQLNRELERRDDKRPHMSDLRESGAIEQDADVICFLYRDEVYSKDQCKDEDRGVAEVIVGKQRMGPCGTVRLAFLDTYARFENLVEHQREEQAPPLDFRGRGRGTYHEPDRERE